jgi:hypothetical protein
MAKKTVDSKQLLKTLKPFSDDDSPVREEYETQQALYDAQPALVKRFLEAQAGRLADAIQKKQGQISFTLPDRVVVSTQVGALPVALPAGQREQVVGGLINRLSGAELRDTLHQRLSELECSDNRSLAVSARLIQHAASLYMVYSMLPSGRSVTYRPAEGEDIPTLPVEASPAPESAITQASDAIAEEGNADANRGTLQVPFVPAARRFYLPQWVAFDDQGKLLVGSVSEAEAMIASMQSYLAVLHGAVSLAPYMIADPVYQQKRYGMLGQLINQGRALAMYQVEEIVKVIKKRAAAHDLNRGLSLSMPYFDDQALDVKIHDLEVIPAGRIMFVPAFVVRAAREEEAKVTQDTRLNPSTRKYLLIELKLLEKAFDKPAGLK